MIKEVYSKQKRESGSNHKQTPRPSTSAGAQGDIQNGNSDGDASPVVCLEAATSWIEDVLDRATPVIVGHESEEGTCMQICEPIQAWQVS